MGALVLPANLLSSTAASAATAAGTTGATTGLSVGLLSNPVTAIAGVGLSLFTAIKGIFNAHHQQAVATEANALNQAIPAVEQSFKTIVGAVDSGSATVDQADTALDQTISGYDNLVYQQLGAKKKSGNGLDYIHGVFQQDADKIKQLFASGGGTVDIPAIPAHAGSQGAAGFTLGFTKPASLSDPAGVLSNAVTDVTGAIGNLIAPSSSGSPSSGPNWILWGAVALVLLLILKR